MSILFVAFFLLNTGITVGLVALERHSTQLKIDELREQHLTIIFDLARQQGRTMASVDLLEAHRGRR